MTSQRMFSNACISHLIIENLTSDTFSSPSTDNRSMVLFFINLIFLIIGLLRAYHGRHLTPILIIFLPTLLFVLCLTIWSALCAHLSNVSHSSSSTATLFLSQASLTELVAVNGLISVTPMLLCETTFQVFGLLEKRLVVTARRWVRYTVSWPGWRI